MAKNHDSKSEILLEILEGTTIQFDLFIKIIYYLATYKDSSFDDESLFLPVAELQIFFILDLYLNSEEIYNLLAEIRSISKRE